MKRLLLTILLITTCTVAVRAQVNSQRVVYVSSNPPTSCVPGKVYTNTGLNPAKAWVGTSTGACTEIDASAAAPANATYITQTPNASLTNEQALSLLGTGIVKNTTTTGVLSIITPGTGVETALAVNVGSPGAFLTFNGNAGTPSALVGTNISGTAASLTAGNATLAANLSRTVNGQSLNGGNISLALASGDFANQGTTTTLLHGNAAGNPSFGAVALGTDVSGTLAAAQFPALAGDTTTSAGSLTTILVNIPTAVPAAGTIIHANIAAPSSPAAGKVAVYSDSTDLRFHDKNASGTIGTTVVADTGAANNYISAISTAGVITKSRPACSTLSDSSTGCTTTVGTAATVNTGTSGATIPLLNAANTWSGIQTTSVAFKVSGGSFASPSGFGQLYYTSASGLLLYGIGSTYDVDILNKNGADVISIPTGTTNVLLSSLAGTGSRAVLADATGLLSAPVSDERFKEPLRPLPESYGLEMVMKLRPSIFKYRDKKRFGSQDYLGFGARETAKILPEVTGQMTDGTYYLSDEKLVVVLIKAVQQQQREIEELKHEKTTTRIIRHRSVRRHARAN